MASKIADNGRIELADIAASVTSGASSERVYDTLADLSTHTAWGGTMHKKKNFGLRSLDGPAGPATVGTEFKSTGIDPMGSFSDGSVVTEASRPSVFEWVTEGRLSPKKKGKPVNETTITHRFEISRQGGGCTVAYKGHVSRWTNAPSMLTAPVIGKIAAMMAASYAKKMLRNLATVAEGRS
ncbi:MAG: SRPBCC family protein [Actinomycetota bacterium]